MPDAVPGTPGFDPERLREALAKASPRPWRWDDGKRSMRLYAGAKQLLKAPKDGHCAPVETGGCGVDIFAAYWPEPADAALIVEAVNSVPSLLATLAERDERIARLEEFGRMAAMDLGLSDLTDEEMADDDVLEPETRGRRPGYVNSDPLIDAYKEVRAALVVADQRAALAALDLVDAPIVAVAPDAKEGTE